MAAESGTEAQPLVVAAESCTAEVWTRDGWHKFPCSRKGKRLVAGRVLCEQHAQIEEARRDR